MKRKVTCMIPCSKICIGWMVRMLYVIYSPVETKSRRSVYRIQHKHHSITNLFHNFIEFKVLIKGHKYHHELVITLSLFNFIRLYDSMNVFWSIHKMSPVFHRLDSISSLLEDFVRVYEFTLSICTRLTANCNWLRMDLTSNFNLTNDTIQEEENYVPDEALLYIPIPEDKTDKIFF